MDSGIPEFMGDGVSGRLVVERDEQALAQAQAIQELVANVEQWPAMGGALAGKKCSGNLISKN